MCVGWLWFYCFEQWIVLCGRYNEANAEYELVGAEVLFCSTFIELEVAVAGIVTLLRKLYESVFPEGCAEHSFYTGVPAAKLEAHIVGLTEEFVFNMRHYRANAYFAYEIEHEIMVGGLVETHPFYYIEQEKIGTIVQEVVKSVFGRE